MRILRHVTQLLEAAAWAVSVAALLVVTLAMVAQVFFRYVLQSPLQWSEPVAVYALVWLVFLGAAGLSAREEHVSIPSLVELFSTRGQAVAAVFSRIATIIFGLIILWYGIQWLAYGAHTLAPGLGFSTRWVKIALPLGAALMVIFTLLRLRHTANATSVETETGPREG